MPRFLFAYVALIITACASTPATYDPVLFAADMQRQDLNPSTIAADAEMTVLLGRVDLTELQRADLLFMRAEKRLDAKYNLPGAIADYQAFILLMPEDPRSAVIGRRTVFAESEIKTVQRRLAQLQNLSDWFDDKVRMGDLEVAAVRYRASSLTPSAGQLHLLREAGFVCAADTDTAVATNPVHSFGIAPEYAAGAVWCDDPSLT